MKIRAFLVISHLLLFGAGAWWAGGTAELARRDQDSEENPPKESRRSAMDRSNRSHRIPAGRLVEAYHYKSAFYRERHPALRTPAELEAMAPARADEITDFAGELQHQVDLLNRTSFPDYRLVKAMIARWMTIDPKAAMLAVGQMETRMGWRDPFAALFKEPCRLSGLELFGLIRDSWHPVHQKEGYEALGPAVGRDAPDQLPLILAELSAEPDQARSFLNNALAEARPADLATWVETVATLPEDWQGDAVKRLAEAWVPASVPRSWSQEKTSSGPTRDPSLADLEGLAERTAGTPLGDLLRARLERLMEKLENQNQRNAAASAPIPSRRPPGATARMPKNSQALQNVVLGKQEMGQALGQQWSLIEHGVDEAVRPEARHSLLAKALVVDPVGTLQFVDTLDQSEVIQGAFETFTRDLDHQISARRVAEVYREFAGTTHWDGLPRRAERLRDVLQQLDKMDPEFAPGWLRDLPQAALQEMRDPRRPEDPANALIDEALQR